jgi:hypothetical protein
LGNGKLTIVSNGYVDYDYSARGFWFDKNTKTFVISYDVSDVSNPKMERLYAVDGSLTESRRIGDAVYVVSTNYFNMPYYLYNNIDDSNFSAKKITPEKIDVSIK